MDKQRLQELAGMQQLNESSGTPAEREAKVEKANGEQRARLIFQWVKTNTINLKEFRALAARYL